MINLQKKKDRITVAVSQCSVLGPSVTFQVLQLVKHINLQSVCRNEWCELVLSSPMYIKTLVPIEARKKQATSNCSKHSPCHWQFACIGCNHLLAGSFIGFIMVMIPRI